MQFQCTCNFDIKGVMDQVLNAWLNALGILMKNKYIMYVNLIIRIINALAMCFVMKLELIITITADWINYNKY